jgi:hypothetical protein
MARAADRKQKTAFCQPRGGNRGSRKQCLVERWEKEAVTKDTQRRGVYMH